MVVSESTQNLSSGTRKRLRLGFNVNIVDLRRRCTTLSARSVNRTSISMIAQLTKFMTDLLAGCSPTDTADMIDLRIHNAVGHVTYSDAKVCWEFLYSQQSANGSVVRESRHDICKMLPVRG